MTTLILVAAIFVGALACPTMAWISRRGRRTASCCMPGRDRLSTPERLQADQAQLVERVRAGREAAAPLNDDHPAATIAASPASHGS